MVPEATAGARPRPFRALAALLAFVVTALVGGGGGQALIGTLQARADQRLQQDAAHFAESVARSLAAQYAKAGQHEIPFEQIPGNQTYLERVLRDTPGVVRIALTGPDGRVMFQAWARGEAPTAAADAGEAAVTVPGPAQSLGEVRVRVSPRALADRSAGWMFPAGLAVIAAVAAALAGWGPGADIARRHRRLADGLVRGVASPSALVAATGAQPTQPSAAAPAAPPNAGGDALDAALRELHQGESRVHERLEQLESLAEELLAVDFDDTLAPQIARVREQALAAVQGPP